MHFQDELSSRLPDLAEEDLIGEANVLMVFQLTGQRKALAAGCRVKKGTLTDDKDAVWKVIRNDEVIHQGNLMSSFVLFCVTTFTFKFIIDLI